MVAELKTVYVGETPYFVKILEGSALSQGETEEVARLIQKGQAVKGTLEQLKSRVKKAHLVAIARWNKDMIAGVAALKAPEEIYLRNLHEWTGVDLSVEELKVELGYVVVAEEHRGAHVRGARLSSELMRELMKTKVGVGAVFATTKVKGIADHALPELGFSYRATYRNNDDENVHLFTKSADGSLS